MNLTTAFLFLFITIVIPGFIFQRFYFYGDFSKQFTTKENVPKLMLTSLIPGLIISSFYLPIFNYFSFDDVKIEKILSVFERLSRSEIHKDVKATKGLANYTNFLKYCFFEFILAGVLGFFCSRVVVRGLKLDRKLKTMRYKNQWYYVFSGEIFEFGKFKKAAKALVKDERRGKDVQLAKADILIKGPDGGELYTGFVVDYDLNPIDISKLENVYLLDATRYKTIDLIEGDLNIKNPQQTEKKLIPGELFVINMANVININVSYLLAPKKDKIKGAIPTWLSLFIKSFSVLFVFGAIFIFYNPEWMDIFSFSKYSWYLKLPILAFYMNIVGNLNPIYDKERKIYYYKKDQLISIIAFAVFIAVYLKIFIF